MDYKEWQEEKDCSAKETADRFNSIVVASRHIRQALQILGLVESTECLSSEELDLANTPLRIAKMWVELTKSVFERSPDIKVFESLHEQMMLLKDIDFVSLCSHHFAPFRGKAHIAYIPEGKLIGISKPARIVDYFACRPQTQELLTNQIAEYLMESLKPKGVMVVLEAMHTCISTRGAKKHGSKFITSAITGVFLKDASAKEEFLALLQLKGE